MSPGQRHTRKKRYVIPDPSTPERVEALRRSYEIIGAHPTAEAGESIPGKRQPMEEPAGTDETKRVPITVRTTTLAVASLHATQGQLDSEELAERRLQVAEGSAEPIVVLKALSSFARPGRSMYFVLDGHHRFRALTEKRIQNVKVALLEPETPIITELPEHLDIMQLPVVKRR